MIVDHNDFIRIRLGKLPNALDTELVVVKLIIGYDNDAGQSFPATFPVSHMRPSFYGNIFLGYRFVMLVIGVPLNASLYEELILVDTRKMPSCLHQARWRFLRNQNEYLLNAIIHIILCSSPGEA
jgi:hypothetical protein